MLRIERLKSGDVNNFSRMAKKVINRTPYYSEEAKRGELARFEPKRIRSKLNDKNCLYLVAKDGNKIVGFDHGYHDSGTFYAEWLGVEENSRRKGIAKKLIAVRERLLKNSGVHKIWADTRTNNREAIALYRKLGYQKTATLKKHWYEQDFYLWHKFL